MIAVCVMALALVLPVQSAWDTSIGANAGFRIGYKSDPKPGEQTMNIIPNGYYPIPETPNVSNIDIENLLQNIMATQDCSPHCQSDDISGPSKLRELYPLLKQLILMMAEQQMNNNPQYDSLFRGQKDCSFFQRFAKAAKAMIGECIADRRRK